MRGQSVQLPKLFLWTKQVEYYKLLRWQHPFRARDNTCSSNVEDSQLKHDQSCQKIHSDPFKYIFRQSGKSCKANKQTKNPQDKIKQKGYCSKLLVTLLGFNLPLQICHCFAKCNLCCPVFRYFVAVNVHEVSNFLRFFFSKKMIP